MQSSHLIVSYSDNNNLYSRFVWKNLLKNNLIHRMNFKLTHSYAMLDSQYHHVSSIAINIVIIASFRFEGAASDPAAHDTHNTFITGHSVTNKGHIFFVYLFISFNYWKNSKELNLLSPFMNICVVFLPKLVMFSS